jgi:endonuclease-3
METPDAQRQRATEIIALLNQAHPDAKLALDFSNPLELLIALILAAQARDELVNSVTAGLFRKYKTAADWATADAAVLEKELGKITFFRNKTRAIQKACRQLVDNFNGQVPDNLEALLTLAGVGRKTANIVLGNAFGHPAIGVDRHVMRVAGRLGLTDKTDPDDIETDLVPIIPPNDQVRFCHLLQFHGRRICLAKKQKCDVCPVKTLCLFPDKA